MQLFSRDSKAQSLGRAPLFDGLSKRELGELASLTEDLEVEAGKVLCREGETAHEFFVLVDGEVDVTRGGERVATLGPGDFFGEIALVERTPRTATVTATTHVRFFVLHGRAFSAVLDRHPAVERKILRALARRLLNVAGDPTVR